MKVFEKQQEQIKNAIPAWLKYFENDKSES